jgi:glycosyltransferase involved in cell wall biosynthesis
VHAHWLPSALPALATRKPFVAQLWGSDVELVTRMPWAFRWLARRSRGLLAASTDLAEAASTLGVRRFLVTQGVEIPETVSEPDEPPHVLYVGRLSEEKGVHELAEATDGLARVVVGDGPLRHLFPDALGFVSPGRLGPFYERACVVVCPSRREGFGVVAREALAYGRPVIATSVGGLVDAVEHDVNGLLVPPNDPLTLRAAIESLLADATLRRKLGAAGRDKARFEWSWDVAVSSIRGAYAAALEPE